MYRTTYPTKPSAWTKFRALPGIVQFGIVLAVVIVGMLVLPLGARADAVARTGSDWVRVTANACADEKVLAHIREARQSPEDFRAAVAYFGGQHFSACWRPMFEHQRALIWYEDGDQGLVPFGDLKPVPSA